MGPFAVAKQFLLHYYPRQYLLAAGILALLFVSLIIASRSNSDVAAPLPEPSSLPESVTTVPFDPFLPEIPETVLPETESLAIIDPRPPESVEITETAAIGWRDIEVKSGDTLSAIFSRVGLSDRELFHVLNSNDEAQVLNRLYPGYKLSFLIPVEGQLEQLQVLKSPLDGYLFSLVDGFYAVETITRTPEIRPVFKHGSITDSLFLAGQKESIPALTIMEMANIFGGVIDFILDPRMGDDFSILFEEKYLDGEFIGTGEILAAQFTNQGKQFVAVQYEDSEGEVGYYNPDGESMRKAFLRTPLDVFRISSNFSLSRRHPILNTIRAHKGTDYAAPKGTPIRATSDGTVTWAGRNGTFGKLIVIKHNGEFETKYAHLNDYANGIRKGQRVRQGDIIGYVGATGSATGPHLHYEFLMNGVHQNPRTIIDKLPKADAVPADQLSRFRDQAAPLLVEFNKLERNRNLALRQQAAD